MYKNVCVSAFGTDHSKRSLRMRVRQYRDSAALHEGFIRVEYRFFVFWCFASKCKFNVLGRLYRAGANKVNAFNHTKAFLNLSQPFWSYLSIHCVLYKNVMVPII